MSIITEIARDFAAPNVHGEFYVQYETIPGTGKISVAKKGYHWRETAALPDLIKRHISREPDASMAVVLDWDEHGDRYARACAFDIDDHDGRRDGRANEVAASIASALTRQGYRPMVVGSGGGDGFHVWLFFERPKRKDQIRKFMGKVLESCGLKEGKGGVYALEVECFPSKGRALIALPFARASQPYRLHDGGLLLADGPPGAVPVSPDQKPGPKPRSRAQVDASAAFEAFIRGKDGGDYDVWVRAGMTTKAALGEQGFALWAAWSAEQPSYQGEHDTREKWDKGFRDVHTPPEVFWAAARRNGYSGGLPDGMEIDKKRGEQAELLDIVRQLPIVRSNEGQAFAEIASRTWADVRSKAVRQVIVRRAYDDAGMLPSPELVKTVLGYAEASATIRSDFHVRCAREAGRVFFSVGDDEATVLELTPSGPEACTTPPVRFKLTDGLPAPVAFRGSIEDLRSLVAVDEDNLHLLIACLVKWLIQPDTSHPIVLLAGPQGSAKSSTMETLVRAIDPRRGLRAAPPTNEGDLVIAASSSYVVSYDNVSSLHALSDALCRLATGGGIRKRELYTDGDTFSLEVKRPVILSGIDPTATQQDLVSRMVRVDLVVPQRRISESALDQLREERLPAVRRFLINLACRVLGGQLPIVDDPDIRLQDFAQVGEAVAIELGRSPGWFTDFYRAMMAEMIEEEAEGDLVATALLALMGNADAAKIEGSSELILRRISAELRDGNIAGHVSDLPRSPRAFSARLRRAIPALSRMGVDVRQGSRRSWIIEKRPIEYADLDSLQEWTVRDGRGDYLVSNGSPPPPF